MNITPEIIIAITSVAAVIIAIVALISETKHSRFALGIDLTLRLNEYFDSERIVKLRKMAAKGVLDKTNEGVVELLNFFETIGLLVKEGALNKKIVWNIFSSYVINYYQAVSDFVREVKRDDKTAWSNLIYLYNELLKIEKQERRCNDADLAISKESLEIFLNDEANL